MTEQAAQVTKNRPKSVVELSIVRLLLDNNFKKILDIVELRDAIKLEDMHERLLEINKKFDRVQMKDLTLNNFTSDRIKLLTNKETVKIPASLLGWRIMGNDGRVKSVVNAVPYIPVKGIDGVDVRRLFGLMLAGSISVGAFEAWNTIKSSRVIIESGVVIYTRMVYKIVDRIVAIGSEQLRGDQIRYCFAKYFLINMLQKTASPDLNTFVLERVIKNNMNKKMLEDFEYTAVKNSTTFKLNTQSDLYELPFMDFLTVLKGAAPWMDRFSTRAFIGNFASMYGTASLLMCEDLITFLQGCCTHCIGAELISSYTFEPISANLADAINSEVALILNKKNNN